MRSKTSRIAKTLPAWALVGLLVVLGSGCMWGPSYYYPACGNPCGYRATIDIDQENYGNGYNRTNFADADIDYGNQRYGGARITIDQENYGNGNTRDNVAYADIENGGGYGGWYWYGGNTKGKIDIDQENYGTGNNRDNAAFATWSW